MGATLQRSLSSIASHRAVRADIGWRNVQPRERVKDPHGAKEVRDLCHVGVPGGQGGETSPTAAAPKKLATATQSGVPLPTGSRCCPSLNCYAFLA